MSVDTRKPPTDVARRMIEAASAWLDALDQDQREKASLDFDDTAERTSWAYFPRMSKGLSLLDMDAKQQKLAHRLIAGALSLHAYTQVTTVMALESVVNLIEDGRMDAFRDPRRYFLSIFGTPGDKRWGWRFEGHHIVLNFTLVDGEIISPTPLFIGAQPSHTMRGDAVVIRPCGLEEDAARELLGSLDAEQRRAAVICEAPPPDFVLMNAPFVPETCLPGEVGFAAADPGDGGSDAGRQREALRFERARPRGLAASQMNRRPAPRCSRSSSASTSTGFRSHSRLRNARGSISKASTSRGRGKSARGDRTITGYRAGRSSSSTTTRRTTPTTSTPSGATRSAISAPTCCAHTSAHEH